MSDQTPSAAYADHFPPDRVEVYRSVGDVALRLHLFVPRVRACRTAVIFFHGGGWRNGDAKQFFPQCRHLSECGVIAMIAAYRLREPHQVSPFEGLVDAKAAIRWVRCHAEQLGVKTDRIVAGGDSVGGHLAAAAAMLSLEEAGGDDATSCIPNALLLCNPVIDTTPVGYGAAFIGPRHRELSPVHHVRPGAPPALVVHGDADETVPVENVRRFARVMQQAGKCPNGPEPGALARLSSKYSVSDSARFWAKSATQRAVV
jgi:acetyl esterase/lipase